MADLQSRATSSPYFIFLRAHPTDAEALEWFGLAAYERRSGSIPHDRGWIHLTECGEWFHICDDWFYHLWHRAERRQVLEELAARLDLFACSAGEADQSYDFVLWRDGARIRERVVDSPHYNDRIVVVDDGSPLPIETAGLWKRDGLEIGLTIAQSLGIDVDHRKKDVRMYVSPTHKPGFETPWGPW